MQTVQTFIPHSIGTYLGTYCNQQSQRLIQFFLGIIRDKSCLICETYKPPADRNNIHVSRLYFVNLTAKLVQCEVLSAKLHFYSAKLISVWLWLWLCEIRGTQQSTCPSKQNFRATEMSQCSGALAVPPGNLSVVPRTRVRQLTHACVYLQLQALPLHVPMYMYTCI